MSRIEILERMRNADLFWGLTSDDYHTPKDPSRIQLAPPRFSDPRLNNDQEPTLYMDLRTEFGRTRTVYIEYYKGDLLSRDPNYLSRSSSHSS